MEPAALCLSQESKHAIAHVYLGLYVRESSSKAEWRGTSEIEQI